MGDMSVWRANLNAMNVDYNLGARLERCKAAKFRRSSSYQCSLGGEVGEKAPRHPELDLGSLLRQCASCHCGLDPQSQIRNELRKSIESVRLRIKSAMTGRGEG